MKFILATLLFALPFWVIAQQNNYTGTIVDENGKALQGATVAVKNTTTKTVPPWERAIAYARTSFRNSCLVDPIFLLILFSC